MNMKVLMASLIMVLFCACALEGVNVIGPAGGFVFYDKGNYSDGWRYLECSPVDAGQDDYIYNSGSGFTYNHEKIEKFCDDFVYNGYDDWRLPNNNELYLMLNAFPKQITDYDDGKYYVSSEKTVYYGDDSERNGKQIIKWTDNSNSISGGAKFTARPVRQF